VIPLMFPVTVRPIFLFFLILLPLLLLLWVGTERCVVLVLVEMAEEGGECL
jgi:hypothetical protein